MHCIGPCRGGPSAPFAEAPPGFRPSVRPSRLPPPIRAPNPKISNRESIRLEKRLTHRKQTVDPHSNREKNACFQLTIYQPRRQPAQIISNREPIRLETPVTRRKQKLDHDSNRENNACFQFATNALVSNRPILRRSAKFPKNATPLPAFLFRVETASTACFLKLTDNSTYTHVSGRASGSAPPSSTATPGCVRSRRAHPHDQYIMLRPQIKPKNSHDAPLTFVSINTNRHPLFSSTYERFLIAPYFD
jgi:hypothetical protein